MLALERIAQFAGDLVVIEPLDCDNFGGIARHSIGDTGTHWYAIDQNRARAANAVLATKMRACQITAFAQKVRQMRARFDAARNRLAINFKRNLIHAPDACRTARASATV